jgi:hypothetical protein
MPQRQIPSGHVFSVQTLPQSQIQNLLLIYVRNIWLEGRDNDVKFVSVRLEGAIQEISRLLIVMPNNHKLQVPEFESVSIPVQMSMTEVNCRTRKNPLQQIEPKHKVKLITMTTNARII